MKNNPQPINPMKIYKQTTRHCGQVWEDGKLIASASGRNAVYLMKFRHGLLVAPEPPKQDGCDNLPTGLEPITPNQSQPCKLGGTIDDLREQLQSEIP